MNEEKIETIKINTNNMEKNLNNDHLNSNPSIDNKIAADNNLEIMDFDLDEENNTIKAIKDKKSFTKTAYASDYDTYIKVVALAFAEGGGKSKKNCVENVSNVVSSVLNRVDDGRFGGHDVISVISAKNQYAGYESKNYKEIIKAFKEGNISDYMSDDQLIAIYNLLDDEKRTTSCNSFRGDGKTNKFYNM